MKSLLRGIILAVFAAIASASAQPLPSVNEFVTKALASTTDHLRSAPEFTFDLKIIQREFDASGKVRKETTTTGESYMSARRNLDIALVVNGRPRKEKEVAKSRRMAVEAMESDLRERADRDLSAKPTAAAGSHFGAQFNEIRMEPYTIFKSCPLSNLRLSTFDDRPAWAIDFSSCGGDAVQKVPFRHLTGVRGTLWIDRETYVIVAVRSWLVGDAPDASPWFEHRMQLFGGSSPTWVPHRAYFNRAASQTLFGARDELDWTVSNPRRFTVETTETIVGGNR